MYIVVAGSIRMEADGVLVGCLHVYSRVARSTYGKI
jgi:hypothetical protein